MPKLLRDCGHRERAAIKLIFSSKDFLFCVLLYSIGLCSSGVLIEALRNSHEQSPSSHRLLLMTQLCSWDNTCSFLLGCVQMGSSHCELHRREASLELPRTEPKFPQAPSPLLQFALHCTSSEKGLHVGIVGKILLARTYGLRSIIISYQTYSQFWQPFSCKSIGHMWHWSSDFLVVLDFFWIPPQSMGVFFRFCVGVWNIWNIPKGSSQNYLCLPFFQKVFGQNSILTKIQQPVCEHISPKLSRFLLFPTVTLWWGSLWVSHRFPPKILCLRFNLPQILSTATLVDNNNTRHLTIFSWEAMTK